MTRRPPNENTKWVYWRGTMDPIYGNSLQKESQDDANSEIQQIMQGVDVAMWLWLPDGPIHAAYNPKLNLTENVFAELDRQLLKNKRADVLKGKIWLIQRTKRKTFWKRQVRRAIRQVNKNKEFFTNQYASFKSRCQAFIASRGKRLKTSKWWT